MGFYVGGCQQGAKISRDYLLVIVKHAVEHQVANFFVKRGTLQVGLDMVANGLCADAVIWTEMSNYPGGITE